MNPQAKKLIKGILLFSIFQLTDQFVGGVDGMNRMKKQCAESLNFLAIDLANIISDLTFLFINMFLVYCFVSGMYRIVTFNLRIREYE